MDIRSAVIRQMKKPMENSITKPIREPVDMFSRRITGMGRMKMARSVNRLVMAFDQLIAS